LWGLLSIKLMTQVWQRLDCTGGELLLALALADIADDNGERIYPGVATLAFKTRQSERQVQRQLKRFRTRKWLQVKKASKGRSATRYRINPAWVNSDILSGFEDVQPRHLEHPTVTFETSNQDIAVSPNPSVSINTPKTHARVSPTDSRGDETQKKIRDAMHDLRLGSTARDPRAIAWRANIDVDLVRAYLAAHPLPAA
jgi:hypothetical protein